MDDYLSNFAEYDEKNKPKGMGEKRLVNPMVKILMKNKALVSGSVFVFLTFSYGLYSLIYDIYNLLINL